MSIEYIIVQAGGRGSRLGKYTENKPKALLSIDNLPMIFHLFNRFPNKKYIIISDYKYDVMVRYLGKFAEIDYKIIKTNEKGTCSGIRESISILPEGNSFVLIWSDLILGDKYNIDKLEDNNYIGISKDFECRWSYKDGYFEERKSYEDGVAGFFIFKDRNIIKDVPVRGEFVKWLKDKGIIFEKINLYGTKEYGDLKSLENKRTELKSRPFNEVKIKGERVIKKPLDKKGEELAVNEIDWYREVNKYGYNAIPKIYRYDPLEMDKVGKALYQVELDEKSKLIVIDNIIEELKKLHSIKQVKKDLGALRNTYYEKTLSRLDSIKELIPFSDNKKILINGKLCKNIYFYKKEFKSIVEDLLYKTDFAFIHGDCTFSNILVDDIKKIYFIDPRGYFGDLKFYGDPYYDWAKLYYSIVGNYDNFNNRKFNLRINEKDVEIEIKQGGWEYLEEYFIRKAKINDIKKLRLIHAVIWLSLTTYVWDDYDSICGAFYKGLEYLNEFI